MLVYFVTYLPTNQSLALTLVGPHLRSHERFHRHCHPDRAYLSVPYLLPGYARARASRPVCSVRMDALHLLANKRLLAIDPGSRYIGLATRTSLLVGARRFGLLERTRPNSIATASAAAVAMGGWTWTLQRIKPETPRQRRREVFDSQAAALESVLLEQKIGGVVFGMPYLPDGSRSRESDEVLRQVRRLRTEWRARVPVVLWDETWSTRIAVGPRQRLGKREAQWTHASAACLILQEVVRALRPFEAQETET